MKYYSLNNKEHFVDFAEAAINGQSPDKGLYFHENIEEYLKGFGRRSGYYWLIHNFR